jgi:hypothetical protein
MSRLQPTTSFPHQNVVSREIREHGMHLACISTADRMDIHFISSLTPDDEDRLAPAILEALKPMLGLMPIAYTIRIRTASNTVYQHTRTELAEALANDASPLDIELSS